VYATVSAALESAEVDVLVDFVSASAVKSKVVEVAGVRSGLDSLLIGDHAALG
jgi:hypothetical protein